MLIKKDTRRVEIFDLYPNENWLNDNNFYLVDDNSELGKKIANIGSLAHYDLVIENGNLIDVVEKEPVVYCTKEEMDEAIANISLTTDSLTDDNQGHVVLRLI